MSRAARREVAAGDRFDFGGNWAAFIASVDDARVRRAARALEAALGAGTLRGARFLDAGCGSGLSSLAARTLGARVRSFDLDPASVACARELKARFRPGDPDWTVEQGSVLDGGYLASLGSFDIVYSWGVLHHTGRMREAMALLPPRVAPGGRLLLALYNDQGWRSGLWRAIKRAYCAGPAPVKGLLLAACFVRLWGPTLARDALRGAPLAGWRGYGGDGAPDERGRGMSPWRDVVDWVGGYPFEVITPDEVFAFHRALGFALEHLRTAGGGHACNEFVFRKG